MTTETAVNPRLKALTDAGTSVWLDQIRRSLVTSGELARIIELECLRGLSANLTILERTILGSDDYDDDLTAMARAELDADAIYERLLLRDVQLACDALADVHGRSHGHDGFVSVELRPELAHDTEAMLAQARSYWQRIGRPNAMVKVPATVEGLRATEEAIHEGINVNVGLVFDVDVYERAAEAYLRGLERRQRDGQSLAVHSVASVLVSRIDTVVDRRLRELGHPELCGRAAIANARAVYRRFQRVFEGGRWEGLRHAGAAVQRPLWAATDVKDAEYRDTVYVEELVGPHTVTAVPLPTFFAVADHARVTGPTGAHDPSQALRQLEQAGIDLRAITPQLLTDGVDELAAAMRRLLAAIEERRDAAGTERPPAVEGSLPAELVRPVSERLRRAVDDQVAERIWRRDASLWGLGSSGGLGWLTVSETMLQHAGELNAFAERCRADGFTEAVVLGMGGSSLGAEVLRRSYGVVPDGLRLSVLDSTHPDVVLRLEESLEPGRTLFVVASKSGETLETLSHYRHFAARARAEQFVAITDPGTPLAALAQDAGFRHVFLNPPDIGGRYSVMSLFGLVPAALMGVDIEALLHGCQVAEQNCAQFESIESNSGLWLGAVLGELALRGRDKLTFVISPPIESFGLWAEQMVAESTGKDGRGIVPVADEPLAVPAAYGHDRAIVYLRNAEAPLDDLDEEIRRLADAGQPTVTLNTRGPGDLGRIFFTSEFATAVAGWALELNPFDQPNVEEAKARTRRVLESGSVPDIAVATDAELRALLGGGAPPEYIAILGFLPPSDRLDEAITELRGVIRSATGVAVTFGYGPRYLHSTGQLHKGGPPTGRFLQLVADPDRDAEIPDAGYSFATLIAAQAAGDLEALRAHGRPAERVKLEGDLADAVRELTGRVVDLLA